MLVWPLSCFLMQLVLDVIVLLLIALQKLVVKLAVDIVNTLSTDITDIIAVAITGMVMVATSITDVVIMVVTSIMAVLDTAAAQEVIVTNVLS
ncbi:MAG: hypothetical protein DWQ19_10105 [Crenarchaeota archaeon]|nr:MAG: hypothetical protein DWQ19_10105 [Thermoproteota archaeon]